MPRLLSVLLLLSSSSMVVTVMAQNQPPYNDCSIQDYYASLFSDTPDQSKWTRAQLSNLLTSTHRTILPVQQEDGDDIYKALIALYPGTDAGVDPNETVQLAFRDVSFNKEPYANAQTWTRANLWPEERMSDVILNEGAKTDIFANVCADSSVFADKGDLFFGECGLFEDPALCQTLPETDQTMTDGKIWQTPIANRGAHARQILYMATRYFKQGDITSVARNGATGNATETETIPPSLELIDCPPFASQNVFGYLSILLEWNNLYNVTDEERNRNNLMCERWQGNRNPFVDYPQLAEQLFGPPDSIKQPAPGENETFRAYSQCFPETTDGGYTIATDAPTHTPNACQDIEPGDIQIILSVSDDPNQMVFFTLAEIPSSVGRIYVTDRPWDGSLLLDNGEGVVSFEVPEVTIDPRGRTCEGFCAGYLFAYNFPVQRVEWSNDTAINGQGDFDLGITGDTMLTYCMSAGGDLHFINGFSYSQSGWAEPGLSADDYGMETSALPEQLKTQGSVSVEYFQNNIYNGSTRLNKEGLLLEFAKPSNYKGSNEVRFSVDELMGNKTDTSAAAMRKASGLLALVPSLVATMAVAASLLL